MSYEVILTSAAVQPPRNRMKVTKLLPMVLGLCLLTSCEQKKDDPDLAQGSYGGCPNLTSYVHY